MASIVVARGIVVIGVIAFAAIGTSQPQGGGGGGGGGAATAIERYWDLHDIEYGSHLGGYNTDLRPIKDTGWNLSGNKVEFTIVVEARKPGVLPGEPTPPEWPKGVDATISDVVITIGGEQVKSLPGPFLMDVPFQVSAPGTSWRIATTKWNDGSPIEVQVQAHFDIVFQNEDGGNFLVQDDYDYTYVFTSYNKLQHLGTPLGPNGVSNPQDIGASTGIAQAAFNALTTHQKSPAAVADTLPVQKSTVIGGTSSHTVIVDATHGTTTYFFDSDGWAGMSDPQNSQMAFLGEILPLARVSPGSGQSGKSDSQPLYNLIVFYSCKAFAAGYCAEAYQVYNALARGGAGFARNVLNMCIRNAPPIEQEDLVGVDAHAAFFFQQLAGGENLGNARLKADEQFWVLDDSGDTSINPMTGIPNAAQEMLTMGDPYTRIKYVYLTPLEKFYLGEGNWNIDILELPVQAPGGG